MCWSCSRTTRTRCARSRGRSSAPLDQPCPAHPKSSPQPSLRPSPHPPPPHTQPVPLTAFPPSRTPQVRELRLLKGAFDKQREKEQKKFAGMFDQQVDEDVAASTAVANAPSADAPTGSEGGSGGGQQHAQASVSAAESDGCKVNISCAESAPAVVDMADGSVDIRWHRGSVNKRIQDLCLLLLPWVYHLTQQVWEVVHLVIDSERYLLKGRHLDQILMCAVYGVCKYGVYFNQAATQKQVTFRHIIEQYMRLYGASEKTYREVHMRPLNEEPKDIIAFYNLIFIPAMKKHLRHVCNPAHATSTSGQPGVTSSALMPSSSSGAAGSGDINEARGSASPRHVSAHGHPDVYVSARSATSQRVATTSTLRFAVGDRVKCQVSDGWKDGTIVKTFYTPYGYQVELDDGGLVFLVDLDTVIRAASGDGAAGAAEAERKTPLETLRSASVVNPKTLQEPLSVGSTSFGSTLLRKIICDENVEQTRKAVEAGMIERVVTNMQAQSQPSPETMQTGCRLLQALTRSKVSPDGGQRAANAGALEAVLAAMRLHESSDMQLCGCDILKSILCRDDAVGLAMKQRAATAGAIGFVALVLRSHLVPGRTSGRALTEACWALACLCAGSDDGGSLRRQAAAQAGAIESVVAAVHLHPNAADLHKYGCWSLATISYNEVPDRALQAGTLHAIVMALSARQPADGVEKLALSLLCFLCQKQREWQPGTSLIIFNCGIWPVIQRAAAQPSRAPDLDRLFNMLTPMASRLLNASGVPIDSQLPPPPSFEWASAATAVVKLKACLVSPGAALGWLGRCEALASAGERASLARAGAIGAVVLTLERYPCHRSVLLTGCLVLCGIAGRDIEQMVHTTAYLASDAPDFFELEAQARAIEGVAGAMRSHPSFADLQVAGCRFLVKNVSETARQRAAAAGVIETLVVAMREHPQTSIVQEVGCSALHGIFQGSDAANRGKRCQRAMEANAIEAIVKAMGSRQAQWAACRALFAICNHAYEDAVRHARTAKRAVDAGAFGAIVRLLQASTAPHILVQGCRVMKVLTLSDADSSRKQRAVEAGAMEAVVKAMKAAQQVAEVQMRGLIALESLCLKRGGRAAISGVVDVVVKAMLLYPQMAELQSPACRALSRLCYGGDEEIMSHIELMLRVSSALEAVVAALRAHMVKDVQEAGRLVIDHIVHTIPELRTHPALQTLDSHLRNPPASTVANVAPADIRTEPTLVAATASSAASSAATAAAASSAATATASSSAATATAASSSAAISAATATAASSTVTAAAALSASNAPRPSPVAAPATDWVRPGSFAPAALSAEVDECTSEAKVTDEVEATEGYPCATVAPISIGSAASSKKNKQKAESEKRRQRKAEIARNKEEAGNTFGEGWLALSEALSTCQDPLRLHAALQAVEPHLALLTLEIREDARMAQERLETLERTQAWAAVPEEEAEYVTPADSATLMCGDSLLDNVGLALNAADAEQDCCPSCLEPWTQLRNEYVVVLGCHHAICAECLAKLQLHAPAAEVSSGVTEDVVTGSSVETRFQCPLCKQLLAKGTLETLAACVYQAEEPLQHLATYLSLAGAEVEVVTTLVIQRCFNMAAVEGILFEMLERRASATFVQCLEPLQAESKQRIYDEARRRPLELQRELEDARAALAAAPETDLRLGPAAVSPERRAKREQCKELQRLLLDAQRKAASDIFMQLNMGELGMGAHTIDFHGLHADEARLKFDELVTPVLPVLREIVIITGRGVHSAGGVGVLRDVLTTYAPTHGFACEVVEGNSGALRVRVN